MVTLKKKIKTILGFISIGALLIGALFLVLTKEKEDNLKIKPSQALNQEKQNYHFENQDIGETKLVCSQLLEETLEKDENTFVFEEYTNIEPVEYLFVGCGGFF